MPPHVILNHCNACAACIDECPSASVIHIDHTYVIDSDSCQDHAACKAVCPVDAITAVQENEKVTDSKQAPG